MLQSILGVFQKITAFRGRNRTLRAINRGLINIIPFVLIGAVVTALVNLPIPVLRTTLETISAGQWRSFGEMIRTSTLEIVGVAALISIAYELSCEQGAVKRGELGVFAPMFAAVSCYVILFVAEVNTEAGDIILPHIDGKGILASLVCTLLAVKLFFAFYTLAKRMRLRKRKSAGRQIAADLEMRSTFRAIPPLLATLVIVAIVHYILGSPFIAGVPTAAMDKLADAWLVSDNFISVLLTVLLMQLLWFLGVQGSDTVLSRFPSIVDTASVLSSEPFASQAATPNAAAAITDAMVNAPVLTDAAVNTPALFANSEFFLIFVSLGGAGATLGLLVSLFVGGSAFRGRRLAKNALFPAVFNINETLLYGLPVVFNPVILIPFLVAPILTASISYLAFALDLVPPIVHTVEWTTPVLFSGYLSTGSISGALLQAFCLAVSFAVYLPFVLLGRRLEDRARISRYQDMRAVAEVAANNEFVTVVSRRDDIGATAREFISELYSHFDSGELPYYLEYQPKTDSEGRLYGAEALLRWQHPVFGNISPVVLIEMTDEAGLSTQLGRWITETVFIQYHDWKLLGINLPRLSLNLNPRHLGEDPEYPEYVCKLKNYYEIEDGEIEMEITEHLAVHSSETMSEMFSRLRAAGIALAIDDMGMGYSSLTYISDYGVGTVKIDASLVSNIGSDTQQQEIVRSIAALSKQLGLEVIVEGVENKEQVDTLVSLGCGYFQGYYFARPMTGDDVVRYAFDHGFANSSKH
jgi:lactose/cellobiose-specific phosphotransferase system IIC component